MAERLKRTDCPVALYVIPGSADDVELHREIAGGVMRRIAQFAGLEQYVEYHGVMSDGVVQRDGTVAEVGLPWRVDAVSNLPSGARVTRRSLIFLTAHDDEATAIEHGAGPTNTHVITYDGPLHPARFTPWVERWLHELLPPSNATGSLPLRSAVEILLRELSVRVLENERLLEQLEEREALVDQLKAQVQFLEAELRRENLDEERVKHGVGAIRRLITTARVSATGTLIAAIAAVGAWVDAHDDSAPPPPQMVGVEINIGDQASAIINYCDSVLHVRDDHRTGTNEEVGDQVRRSGRSSYGTGNTETRRLRITEPR